MAAFLIIIGILLALLALLLWLPMGLKIDTRHNQYLAYYGPWLQASVLPDPEEFLRLRLKLLFWKLQWSLRELTSKKKPSPAKKRRSFARRERRSFSPAKIRRLMRSFRIVEFRWELDTGNPVLNAKLYPVFFLSEYRWGGTRLNFEGRNSLVLRVENRPIRIITAWIHP